MNATNIQTQTGSEASAHEKKRPTWEEYVGIEEYAMAIYRLQKDAGLSFREARATLRPFQVIPNLAEEWGCTVENIHNMRRIGHDKVRKFADGDGETIERLLPQELTHIF